MFDAVQLATARFVAVSNTVTVMLPKKSLWGLTVPFITTHSYRLKVVPGALGL
jgi:hypothetical protein